MIKAILSYLKAALVGLGVAITLFTFINLVVWFVTFEFPIKEFVINQTTREAVCWIVGISWFLNLIWPREDNFDGDTYLKAERLMLYRENKELKQRLRNSQPINTQGCHHTTINNKGTSALDIAVGVGTGIVGAEIVCDLLDL
jgi:hypothetical protein